MNKLVTPLSCILLVDDDPITNYLHQSLLEDMGVSTQILVAINGKDALETIAINCTDSCFPQLILLDINMPVMNGFEFLAEYYRLPIAHLGRAPQRSVVIMMLTTSMNPRDVKQVEGLVTGFLSKPLTEQMVIQMLEANFPTQ